VLALSQLTLLVESKYIIYVKNKIVEGDPRIIIEGMKNQFENWKLKARLKYIIPTFKACVWERSCFHVCNRIDQTQLPILARIGIKLGWLI
jgi:hypothetical protein